MNSSSVCQSLATECWQKYFNASHALMESCYLKAPCFEPQSINRNVLYPLSIVYSLILISGVMGNLVTCLVIVTSKYSLLQTTTNRYLLNLSLADLVSLISGIPFEIYLMWNQYPWHPPDFVCNLKAWVSETTSYVSVLTIVTFSIERYLAICHSFAMTKLLTSINRRLSLILLLIWFVAGLCAIPFGVYHRADFIIQKWPGDTGETDYGPVRKTKMCMLAIAFEPNLRTVFQILFHLSALLFFFLPLAALICLYGKVACAVKQSKRRLNSYREKKQSFINDLDRKSSTNTIMSLASINRKSSSNNMSAASSNSLNCNGSRQDYDSKKVLTILVAVVTTFFICYAPYQAQRLLFFYIENPHAHQMINTYLFTISGILFYFSSILNPILYNVISSRYRRAFREVLCRCFNSKIVYERRFHEKCQRRLQKQSLNGVCGKCAAGWRPVANRSPSQISSAKTLVPTSLKDSKITKNPRASLNEEMTSGKHSLLARSARSSSHAFSKAPSQPHCSVITSANVPCMEGTKHAAYGPRRISTVPEEPGYEKACCLLETANKETRENIVL